LLAAMASANFETQDVVDWIHKMRAVLDGLHTEYYCIQPQLRYTGKSIVMVFGEGYMHPKPPEHPHRSWRQPLGQRRWVRRCPDVITTTEDKLVWWEIMEDFEDNVKHLCTALKNNCIKRTEI